jgi:tripartite-type tricarboxylate transporter receptor subunit TctC
MRLIAILFLAFSANAVCQGFPSRPVRIVAPGAPGAAGDVLARVVASKLSDTIGAQTIVENRLGAGGVTASDYVAKSAPDGHTIMVGFNSTHGSVIFFSKNVPYDPVKDFTPISGGAEAQTGLAVHPSLPVTNAKEFVEYAKKNPGKLSYGTPGFGSSTHFTFEMFKLAAGIDVLHVPYKGSAPAMVDLIGGQIPVMFATMPSLMANVQAGKVRLLAVVENKRYRKMPEVPTLSETVLPGFNPPVIWLAFFGPAGIPAPVLEKLNANIVGALKSPDVRAKLDGAGLEPMPSTSAELAALIRSDIEIYRKITTQLGIKPE